MRVERQFTPTKLIFETEYDLLEFTSFLNYTKKYFLENRNSLDILMKKDPKYFNYINAIQEKLK